MVVICLGPICLPLWPVVALTLKPVWDRFVPEPIKRGIEDSWSRIRAYICPARQKQQRTTSEPIKAAGGKGGDNRIIKISSPEQYRTVLKDALPVVVKFTADFCGPCKMIAPHFNELASKFHQKIVFCEVDIEEIEDIALKAGVSSIPAFHLMVNGGKVDQVIGTNMARLTELCENLVRKIQLNPSLSDESKKAK